MLCVIARIDEASRKRLSAVQRRVGRFGLAPGGVYGHITLATYVGEDENGFMASCRSILSRFGPFPICYERIEVLEATSIIVAAPRDAGELRAIHREIAERWRLSLDYWTGTEAWKPHTTLLYAPSVDLQAVARDMREEFISFPARVENVEFSRVREGGYKIVGSVDLLK